MKQAITVSQLTFYLENLLKRDVHLQGVLVKGQVVNLKRARFLYFDLRDDQALIHCVCFDRSLDWTLLQEGMEFLVSGSLAIYRAGGIYQIRVTGFQPMGQGAKYLELLALKKKLNEEGLFKPERKRPLKTFPRGIGLVSSASGAVLHDFCNEVNIRFPLVPIYFAPASVQGEAASSQIIQALRELVYFSYKHPIDVIVVARGGGSGDDLSVFNEEKLVRTIAACPLPVVTAIGHQVDNSLSDLVADRRASTPTEAASLVTPDRLQLMQAIDGLMTRARSLTLEGIHRQGRRLHQLQKIAEDLHPRVRIQRSLLQVNQVRNRLMPTVLDRIQSKRKDLDRLKALTHDAYQKALERQNRALSQSAVWSLFTLEGKAIRGDDEVLVDSSYLMKSKAYSYQIAIEKKEKNDPDDRRKS